MDDIGTTVKEGLSSGKDSVGTTTTVILLLLGVIVVVMSYNYWMMYRLQKDNLTTEPFGENDARNEGASDKAPIAASNGISNDNTDVKTCVNGSDGTVCPTVRSVLDHVSQYKEGGVSEKLKQHIADNKAAQDAKTQAQLQAQAQVKAQQYAKKQGPGQGQGQKQVLGQDQQQRQGQRNTSQNQIKTNEKKKSETPENGVFKVIIYHMPSCGHCKAIMERNRPDEKSHFEKLNDIFGNDESVVVMDFQLGRDNEAKKFQFFPTIMFVTEQGAEEYRGGRDAVSIAKAVIDKKN